MKVVVTGGAGFIGSAVCRYMVDRLNWQVLNLDKLTYAANLASLSSVEGNKNYQFQKVDICDAHAVDAAFDAFKPDAIMHLAAESHVDRSIDGPGQFIHTNIVGTYTLLEAARRYWLKLPDGRRESFRFHHISTDEVYGSLGDEGLFTENSAYCPNSPYSASKAGSDHLVRAWGETYGLPVLVSNCSNNYGPFQFPEKLIPLITLNALHGKKLPVYGQGLNIRDWLYVDDHADALCRVLKNGVVGESYNIGGHNEVSNIDVVRKIFTCLLKLAPTLPEPNLDKLLEYVADRPGHDWRYAIDASKIERDLGWRPQYSFEQGLELTVRWYLDNETWWQSVAEKAVWTKRLGVRGVN